METIKWIISTAPEIFLLISISLGTFVGRLQFKGFSIGATACTLVVAVLLGQLGHFVIPPLFKSIFFSLFVFTIGYKSGPEFFASLSLRTLTQVGLALIVSVTGLSIVLAFAFAFLLVIPAGNPLFLFVIPAGNLLFSFVVACSPSRPHETKTATA